MVIKSSRSVTIFVTVPVILRIDPIAGQQFIQTGDDPGPSYRSPLFERGFSTYNSGDHLTGQFLPARTWLKFNAIRT